MARKPTKKYELLVARYDGLDEEGKAKRYVRGDLVPLTENEYAAFGDKFGAEESRTKPVARPITPPKQETTTTTQPQGAAS